jgi:heme/copper-type cytochrome/quinol oxidase subunit 2
LLIAFLVAGITAILRMSLIVFPIIGVGIWTAARVRRRNNRNRAGSRTGPSTRS